MTDPRPIAAHPRRTFDGHDTSPGRAGGHGPPCLPRAPARVFLFLALAAAALAVGTGCPRSGSGRVTPPAPAPGHTGAVPSARAQRLLKGLVGATFTDAAGALGGGAWVIDTFMVGPNPASTGGSGAFILLRRGALVRYVPIESDADAADFIRRTGGTPPEGLSGPTSDTYRKVMGKPR